MSRDAKVALVARLAADVLAKTLVPMTDDQAVRLALALVEKGWRNARSEGSGRKGRRS